VRRDYIDYVGSEYSLTLAGIKTLAREAGRSGEEMVLSIEYL